MNKFIACSRVPRSALAGAAPQRRGPGVRMSRLKVLYNEAVANLPVEAVQTAMLESAPAVIFYPVITLWSLLYGSLAGAWFKLLAVYENWIEMNRYHLILWKKYPQRSYLKYISGIWATQIKDKPVELAEYTRHQIEKSRPTEPFPVGRIFINTIFMLIVTPFIIFTGLYKGPIYVFRRALARRRELLATGG